MYLEILFAIFSVTDKLLLKDYTGEIMNIFEAVYNFSFVSKVLTKNRINAFSKFVIKNLNSLFYSIFFNIYALI